MDRIRNGYYAYMKLWADSDALTLVRWVRARKGAKVFPGPHAFGSAYWLRGDPGAPVPDGLPLGEQPGIQPWYVGRARKYYLGQEFCGRIEAFATGGVQGVDPPLALLPDLTPVCCQVGFVGASNMCGCGGAGVILLIGMELLNDLYPGDYLHVIKLTADNATGIRFLQADDLSIHIAGIDADELSTGMLSHGSQNIGGSKTFFGSQTTFLHHILLGDTSLSTVANIDWAGSGNYLHSSPVGTSRRVTLGVDGDSGTGVHIAVYSTDWGGSLSGVHFEDNSGGPVHLYVGSAVGQTGTEAGLQFVSGLWVGGSFTGGITGGSGGDTGLSLTVIGTTLTLSGILNVAHGGTGDDSIAAHAVVLGHDTLPFGSATVGLSGRVLLDQGPTADPAFTVIAGDAELDGFGDLTIQPAAVTYSKIQDVAALSLLGNPTGADTIATEVRLGPGLAFSSDSITLTSAAPQAANTVLAGPITGGSDTPTFRALVPADVPNLSAAKITSGVLGLAEGGTGADLSATGGVGQYVTQSSAGGVFTVGVISAADVPTISGGKIGSGTVGLGVGGTGTDLSATGGTGKLLFQETVGGSVTVRALAAADIPNLSAAKITSGTLALAVGGTGANLSATGGGDTILAQPVLGGAVVPTSLAAMLDALGGISGSFG